MTIHYKPMLAVACGDVAALTFPMLASPKLDGVRAIVTRDGVLSRSLKVIPNRHVQTALANLPAGLDGELIVGDPTAPDAYRRTVSVTMSEEADIWELRYYVFDMQGHGEYWRRVNTAARAADGRLVKIVPNYLVNNAEDVAALEERLVSAGYEGVMLRRSDAPYKHGRSTLKEGYLLKLKRFTDSEAEVIGVTELMHNGNEPVKNELGRTARSSHKAGKTGTGTLGALKVRDVHTGVEFEIGTGFTMEEREDLWKRLSDAGPVPISARLPLAKYKYFAGGSKDKPRFPVFIGWRDRIDT